jgi:hypothetical protein
VGWQNHTLNRLKICADNVIFLKYENQYKGQYEKFKQIPARVGSFPSALFISIFAVESFLAGSPGARTIPQLAQPLSRTAAP